MLWDRAFDEIFDPQTDLALFDKNGCHLELHLSWKKCIYRGNVVRLCNIDNILGPQATCRVIWHFFGKNLFPPFLAAILKFCVKHKNAFISEMVQDRVISTKLLALRE